MNKLIYNKERLSWQNFYSCAK